MMDGQRPTPTARLAGTAGALFGLVATALAAIGSHALAPGLGADDLRRLVLGIAFLFVHALLLVAIGAIARHGGRGLVLAASALLVVVGTLLFSGSLLARVLFGASTALAPFGGVALMLGWLALAAWFVVARRP
jgi:uncharacterized membrane protein YgdD (TMEM256/DUF423 family)